MITRYKSIVRAPHCLSRRLYRTSRHYYTRPIERAYRPDRVSYMAGGAK